MGCGTSEKSREFKGKITTYKEFFDAIAKGAKLIVLENDVLCVENFIAVHPGGTETIGRYVGMEVGRFYYGGFKLIGKLPHMHTADAQKKLESMIISTIHEPFKNMIFKPLKFPPAVEVENDIWKLVGKAPVSAVHSMFQFKSENYKSSAMLPYFDHCGKYYTLYSKHLNMYRNLACIFTPSPTILPQYLKLLEAFGKGEPFATPFPDINNVTKEHLELYLKKLNVFSTFLHEFPIGNEEAKGIKNEFQIRGPFGPGIAVEPDQKGTVVGITCGTGVVLFLDLAMYLLRKNVYAVGKQQGKEYKLFGNENFDRLNDPSFKLILYSAFKHKDHVLAEVAFRALQDISTKFKFNNFEYHLRLSENAEDPKWDEEFFKKTLDMNATKIVVYGPYGAEESIKKTLRKIGIKDSQFHRI